MVVHEIKDLLISVGQIGDFSFGQEINCARYSLDQLSVFHFMAHQLEQVFSVLVDHIGLLKHGPDVLVGLVGVDHGQDEQLV